MSPTHSPAPKRPGALWATEGPSAQRQMPLPLAVACALLAVAVVGGTLSQVDWHPAIAQAQALTQAVLLDPPKPPPPPPPKPPEVQKVVKAVAPKTAPSPTPPQPAAPAPPARIVEAAQPTPTAPAIATAPPTREPSLPTAPLVSAPPAPPAPPALAAPRAPTSGDIGVACPGQVRPEMPRRALMEEITGTVRARALIDNGAVKEVTILSGPKVFHNAVRNAMLRYKCVASGTGEVMAEQDFVFKLE